MWATTEIPRFDRDSLTALEAAEVPGVRLPGFASADELRALGDLLLAEAVRTRTIQEVTRLGISQYEQGLRGSKADYFRQAASLVPSFDRIFGRSFDPVDRLLDRLGSVGIDAGVMVEPGFGPYWAGTGKLRNGVGPIHVDFAPQDAAGWAIADARVQLAWNVYLDNPDGGGDLRVWDRAWTREDDDLHQIPDHYAFRADVVTDVPKVDVPVEVGDVVLVNSGMYHTVTEATGRLAFGSFISVFDDGRYRLWS